MIKPIMNTISKVVRGIKSWRCCRQLCLDSDQCNFWVSAHQYLHIFQIFTWHLLGECSISFSLGHGCKKQKMWHLQHFWTKDASFMTFPNLQQNSVNAFEISFMQESLCTTVFIRLCQKKHKLEFCFDLLGALEGGYGDPTKRFSNLQTHKRYLASPFQFRRGYRWGNIQKSFSDDNF